MSHKSGPFKVISNSHSLVQHIPYRNYECDNYTTCLSLAAALNWRSFSCHNCCGEVNPQLIWRAHQNIKSDKTLATFCELPPLSQEDSAKIETPLSLVHNDKI